ncbi:MAG: NAD-dependent epimerase/dehydratase family protein [Treponema sp.]|jgi:dihydroflavonol-4-reductase|nr:NAD-dependent epimerase/dehydratase family protein [Treponema sp.]
MATILHTVTGVTGRTGGALCAELKKRGAKVRALVRKSAERYLPFLEPYVDEFVWGDIRDVESLKAAFSGAAYVYHLAGIVSIASKIDPQIRAVNIDGVKNVIDACLETGVKRLVYVGTCHTIPFYDKTSTLREVPRFKPEELSGAYAVSKAIASNLVLDAVSERGLDAVIGMPTGIVGGFELQRSNFGQMVVDVAERRLPAYVSGRYDFVDVTDVAKALADLALKGVKGESYLISGYQVTAKEVIQWAAEAAKTPMPKLCVPLGLLKVISYFTEWYSLKRHRTLMLTPYAVKVLGDNSRFSHEKLSALTGYNPRPLKEAIAEQVAFYFDVYKPNF